MSHKILHTVAGGALGILGGGHPLGGILSGVGLAKEIFGHKHTAAPVGFQPTKLDDNQTTMQADGSQLPRRRVQAPAPSSGGTSILSDTLG